ncbi:hypothetical protein LTR10_007388 [Elasticomyces elasticus]|nr:hypothetical protein LTR10_007388 [Elasticomyces elasticus]KAK4979199.1 hypothetical protein LTR42_001702 [Elasticomyces elasticus]
MSALSSNSELMTSQPAILDQTIGSRLKETVGQHPDRLAVKSTTLRLTYRELDEQSDALAAALQALGIQAGDRVACSLGTSIAHLLVIYACFKSGAILTSLNPSYTSQQVVSALRHVDVRCYIASSDILLPYKAPVSSSTLLKSVFAACDKDDGQVSVSSVIVASNGAPNEQAIQDSRVWAFEDLLEAHRGRVVEPATKLHQDDTISLQFTSGTTSSPKAVALDHWSILNNANVVSHLWETTCEDVFVCTVPLYHTTGITALVLAAMLHGACLSMPCEAFNAQQMLRAVVEDRCTILHGVPTMFQAFVRLRYSPEFAAHDFSHIRTGFIGAAPIPSSLREKLNQQLNLSGIGNAYGMTETCPAVSVSTREDPDEQKFYSVGRPIPHATVRITARDDPHQTLNVGERGEVLVAGMLMKEYWGDPERTAAAITTTVSDDGIKTRWMHTGDEGVLDMQGFLTVTGRIKDIIIRGGENIYPPEVENILMQCPGIESVAVVGIDDEAYGEVVGAFIVLTSGTVINLTEDTKSYFIDLRQTTGLQTADDASGSVVLTAAKAREWVQARLSRHLVPKYVFLVDELPTTPTGKVEKHKLRTQGCAALAITGAIAGGA